MTIVTTVDEKLTQPVVQEEPIKEEVSYEESKTEEPKAEEVKVSDESLPKDISSEPKQSSPEKPHTDEFGNEVAPSKTYTEEEVNQLMRERFNRTAKEAQRQDPKPEQSQTDENWEAQLEGFVENTVKKMTHKEQEALRRHRDEQNHQEFQVKFTTGMNKYKDFQEVVSQAPISDDMLLSTKKMKDPAGFIYAASKTQKKELERISQIDDGLSQALEMGKLEERMRKVRTGTSTPKPVGEIKGDVENKSYIRPSVDDLIRKDQLKKFGRRA
jgi:hypothetical protein